MVTLEPEIHAPPHDPDTRKMILEKMSKDSIFNEKAKTFTWPRSYLSRVYHYCLGIPINLDEVHLPIMFVPFFFTLVEKVHALKGSTMDSGPSSWSLNASTTSKRVPKEDLGTVVTKEDHSSPSKVRSEATTTANHADPTPDAVDTGVLQNDLVASEPPSPQVVQHVVDNVKRILHLTEGLSFTHAPPYPDSIRCLEHR